MFSPSARDRPGGVCSRCPFACLWQTRSVLFSGRSKLCPLSSRVTPKNGLHRQLRRAQYAVTHRQTANRVSLKNLVLQVTDSVEKVFLGSQLVAMPVNVDRSRRRSAGCIELTVFQCS